MPTSNIGNISSTTPQNEFGIIARSATRVLAKQTSNPLALASRVSLGLSPKIPVIMGGHQAALWHPGILAKRFAASSLAETYKGQAAWIVVDSDTNDGGVIAFPSHDEQHNPTRQTWKWLNDQREEESTPLCCIASQHPASLPSQKTVWNSGVFELLGRASKALSATHNAERTVADQLTQATATLLAGIESGSPHIAMTSRLCHTPIFERLWQAMIADPASCVAAYNVAAREHRGSGIRELSTAGNSFELPVWQIENSRRRVVRVKSREDVSKIDIQTLAPKALLLSAIMRLSLCDICIHGLGAEGYDRVMELWLNKWLPTVSDSELRSLTFAPSIVVSATMRLRFEGVDVLTPQEIARRVWTAHHAKHNPGWNTSTIAGKRDWSGEKRNLLDAISASKQRGTDPLPHYRALHKLLEESRLEFSSLLASLDEESQRAKGMTALAEIVHDRTWSFALHDQGDLARFRDQMDRIIRKQYSR